jgi:hypothetical protein
MDEKKFFFKWISACGLGGFLGMAAAVSLSIYLIEELGEPYSLNEFILYYFFSVIAGAIQGSITGFMQWNVLTMKYKSIKSFDWILYTAGGTIFIWILGMSMPFLLFSAKESLFENFPATPGNIIIASFISGQVFGCLLGFFQWLVLRKHTVKATVWIRANGVAWSIAMTIIFGTPLLLEGIVSGTWGHIIFGALSGMAGGLAVGVFTGIFIKKIHPLKSKYIIWEKV